MGVEGGDAGDVRRLGRRNGRLLGGDLGMQQLGAGRGAEVPRCWSVCSAAASIREPSAIARAFQRERSWSSSSMRFPAASRRPAARECWKRSRASRASRASTSGYRGMRCATRLARQIASPARAGRTKSRSLPEDPALANSSRHPLT